MNDAPGYAVFFFPPALEALGDAIKPYLRDGPQGPHVPCREVDTAGAFVELTVQGPNAEGHPLVVEVMVPTNMVRLIASVRSDSDFGFYDRNRPMVEPGLPAYTLPAGAPTGPSAAPAEPASTPPEEEGEQPRGEPAGATPVPAAASAGAGVPQTPGA